MQKSTVELLATTLPKLLMPDYAPSMADDVCTYLAANSLGSIGVDIFSNHAPVNKNDFILVTDTGGSPPEQYYAIDHPTVQVAVYGMAGSHAATWQKVLDCFHLLNRKQNITIGTRDAMYARAVASPQVIGLDPEKSRWLMVINIQFKIRGVDGE